MILESWGDGLGLRYARVPAPGDGPEPRGSPHWSRARGGPLRDSPERHRVARRPRRHARVEDPESFASAPSRAAVKTVVRERQDDQRQQVADRHARREAEPDEVRAVLRVERTDPQVAHQREAEASADRVPVERRDDRHRDVEQRQERFVHRERLLVRCTLVPLALER